MTMERPTMSSGLTYSRMPAQIWRGVPEPSSTWSFKSLSAWGWNSAERTLATRRSSLAKSSMVIWGLATGAAEGTAGGAGGAAGGGVGVSDIGGRLGGKKGEGGK